MSKLITASSIDKLAKGVDAEFIDVFDQHVDEYMSPLVNLFKSRNSDKLREHTKGIGGAGILEEVNDGASTPLSDYHLAYETEYVKNEYRKGISVTHKLMRFKDYQDKLDEFQMLSRGARKTFDKAMAQVFNGAFATTKKVNGITLSLYGDAVPLCSTVHPIIDGGTDTNASSTSAPLSINALDDGITAISELEADDGQPLELSSRVALVVPPKLKPTALRLTGSELDPETSNNAVNIYRGNIDVYEVTWLGAKYGGSDTQWFLVAEQSKLMAFRAGGPDMMITTNDANTARTYHVIDFHNVGHSDWRFVYGSKGDGSAYSS